MAKFKLIFFSSLLVAAGLLFIFREKVFNYFEPAFVSVEKLAIEAAVKEIKKEFQAPPPLRAPVASTEKPTSGTIASQSQLTIAGVIQWTNIQRNNNGGLSPLAENSDLNTVARLRLEDMFAKQYFAHVSPNGSSAETEADIVGYDYIALGENLALGNFDDDEDLVQAWMDSPGHRANILNVKYLEIGVAVGKGIFSAEGGSASGGEGKSTWIGVQIFGKPAASCPRMNPELKVKIDTTQNQLEDLQKTLIALKAELDNTKPKGGRQYNEKVDQYNDVVAQYNNLLSQAKTMIAEYNAEVAAFNQCLAG
ncbi:MAG: CAP domain-containing protein [bacterium]|nr:CAP domain-containing protein [bacterium]